MKKLFCLMLLGILGVGRMTAQSVEYYGFQATQGDTYTALEGAVELAETMRAPAAEFPLTLFNATESVYLTTGDTSMAGIPLGFDFEFEGKVYDKFVVVGMGYIYLGLKDHEKVKVDVGGGRPSVNDMWRTVWPTIGVSSDAADTCVAPVRYKAEGETGSKVMTVEFAGLKYAGLEAGPFRYQIRLHQAGSRIEILFDGWEIPYWYQRLAVGLSGESGNNYRQPVEGNWNNTTRNTANGWVQASSTIFEAGLLYTFTVPAACEKPTITVSDPDFTTVTSTQIELTAGVEAGKADAYLIVVSEEAVTGMPEDGKTYVKGDELLGGKVLDVQDLSGEETEITVLHEELDPNTEYHYAIFLYNYKCSGEVKYGDATRGNMKTNTSAPASLKITALSDTEIGLRAEANTLDEQILVAVTEVLGADRVGNRILIGDFGIPAEDAAVGDTIEKDGGFGGKVIYVGVAGGSIVYGEDIADNRIYHFAAFSKRADGAYSSVFAQADTITPARIPFFEDFGTMPQFTEPYGWVGTTEFKVQRPDPDGNGSVQVQFRPDGTPGVVYTAQLALPVLSVPEGPGVRCVLDYGMSSFKSRMDNSLNRADWTDNDSIVFEYSTDGGTTWKTSYAVTKLNADEFPTGKERYRRYITLKGFSGEQVLIRMRYVATFTYQTTMTVYSVGLVEVPECDYPLDVAVVDSTIIGDKASLTWTPGESGERSWNYSLAMKEGDTYGDWTPAKEIAQNPYYLEGLETNKTYKVRVQAVCGVGKTSDWVESAEFTSGWSVPFMEDFNALPYVMQGRDIKVSAPNGWSMKKHFPEGALSGTVDVNTQMADAEMVLNMAEAVNFYQWKTTDPAYPDGSANGSFAFDMTYGNVANFLILPVVSIDEEGVSLVFDAAYGRIWENGLEKVTETSDLFKMYLLVSEDGGKTFDIESAVKTWDAAALVALGDTTRISVDLSAYDGNIVAALAVVSVGEQTEDYAGQMLWIDNMGIVYGCSPAKDIEIESLTETAATLVWRNDPTVEEWIVKVEGNDKTGLYATEANRIELEDLEPVTLYEVSVGRLCEEDTVWSSIEFTTGGTECDPIADLSVTNITKTSADLSWTGDAAGYKVRIRPVSATETAWTVYTTERNSYAFALLQPGVEYEGGVQAVCGMAAGDTSDYVAFTSFTTDEENCFAPEELTVSEVSYASARLAWEGDADDYQVAYRKENTTAVLGVENVVGARTYTLDGLAAKTPYQVRVRSICGSGDTSAWCDWESFTTTEVPACPVPTGLESEAVTENSARLSWVCEEEGAGFILRYRIASEPMYDSVKDLTATSYELMGLQARTAYMWWVMTACSEGRYSGWSAAGNFETTGVGNEDPASAGLIVSASKGQIHVLNPSAVRIDRIRVVGTDGSLLEDYTVRSDGNVLLTTAVSMKVAVVVVESAGNTYRFKVLLP